LKISSGASMVGSLGHEVDFVAHRPRKRKRAPPALQLSYGIPGNVGKSSERMKNKLKELHVLRLIHCGGSRRRAPNESGCRP
jgi:hypothetical protein